MASLLRRSSNSNYSDVDEPLNKTNAIRIAFLGGAKSGKTSLISKLSLGNFSDTYYPTHKINPILFTYTPGGYLSRTLLDEYTVENTLGYLSKVTHIILSPVLYKSCSKTAKRRMNDSETTVINFKNDYYAAYSHPSESLGKYAPPQISPILVELIDSPSFNPDQVVPFLEASLYMKLGEDILRNLANEPRRPVSTNPLLVASGASELNGNVDGYIFVYSAVPAQSPPSYSDAVSNGADKELKKGDQVDKPDEGSAIPLLHKIPGDVTFKLLSIMKSALDEAWKEYNTFRKKWEQGKENDFFSLKSALKVLWREQNLAESEQMRQELRKDIKLIDNPVDPSSPDCPPPIWIVCTHSHSPLKSPLLIENGIKLSKFWKCGFLAVDNTDESVDEILALMIKEITCRKKLQKQSR